MVFAKTKLFDIELQASAELYKALGHPARLAILKYLASTKTCITGDFADELPLSRTTVNQHLTELREAGLIICHTEGVKTFYCLNPQKIGELKEMSNLFLGEISTTDECSC